MVLIAKDTEASYNSQQSLLTGVDVAGFSKIFSTMWGGSLYGHFEASAVFMVLLSLCDRDGTIDMTPEAIAGHTGWPLDLIRTGIAELAAPDPRSRTKGHEGRRILPLDEHRDWGWRITNYQKYRDEMRSAERREYLRQAKQAERAKKSTPVNSVNNVNQCQPIADAEAENTNTFGFASFWSEWPSHERKAAKKQCLAKWKKLGCEEVTKDIIKAVRHFKESEGWRKDAGAYIPAPLTWLNQKRWELELPKCPQTASESSRIVLDDMEAARAASQSESSKKARELALQALKVVR
jgi:hypothetical protein